nr:hypothetical protein [Candidatus Aquiluna sp. UB-MaderosW2red]
MNTPLTNDPEVDPVEVIFTVAAVPAIVNELDAEDGLEVPAAFVAVTVKVYAWLGTNPDTAIVPDPAWEIDPVIPDGDEVAVYEVMVEPPFEDGAVKLTFAVLAPVAVTETLVGWPAVVRGVAVAVAPVLVPIVLVALTVKV